MWNFNYLSPLFCAGYAEISLKSQETYCATTRHCWFCPLGLHWGPIWLPAWLPLVFWLFHPQFLHLSCRKRWWSRAKMCGWFKALVIRNKRKMGLILATVVSLELRAPKDLQKTEKTKENEQWPVFSARISSICTTVAKISPSSCYLLLLEPWINARPSSLPARQMQKLRATEPKNERQPCWKPYWALSLIHIWRCRRAI